MRGKKTTIVEPLLPIIRLLKRKGIENISAGYIRSVKGRRDSTIDVKIQEIKGGILLSCTTKRYHQEIRIYTEKTPEEMFPILTFFLSSERFRVRKNSR